MFFWKLSCVFHDSVDVGNMISGSSAFSKTSLNIWKFTVHILLKPGLENFEHYFTSVWDECNCAIVWVFFGTAFLWDWNENWPFPVLWPLLSFPNLRLLAFIKCWIKLKYQFQSSCVLPSLKQHWIVISGDYKTEGCWNLKFDLGSDFPGLCRNFILYNENCNVRIMSIPTHKILSLGIHWEINRRIKHFNKYFVSLHTPSAWGKYLHLNVFWV